MKDIISDVNRARQRAKDSKYLETRKALIDDVYPLLQSLALAVDERIETIETQVAELLAETESIIQPELGDQIQKTLLAGLQLCDAIGELPLDDLTKKRFGEAVHAFKVAVAATSEAVTEATLEVEYAEEEDDDGELAADGDDDEDLEDDDEDEGDEDDDEEEDELTVDAVEPPVEERKE